MSIKTQKDAFLKYEADSYYQRNKDVQYDVNHDVVVKVLQEYGENPKNVLEIGCSTGYRLNAISSLFKGAAVTGIEPSKEAIEKGKILYPAINFVQGTADEMSSFKSASFDLVVIGFVLYVVDREILFQVISETDRVLANGGTLMIIDFFSENPIKNSYQHIKDIPAFAFKQNYYEIFTSSKLYHLLDKRSLSHSTKSYDLSSNYYDKYAFTTLKKDLFAGYSEIKK
jgi:ubiquinone/menaquinone biosynthesis C-methylase UbiE